MVASNNGAPRPGMVRGHLVTSICTIIIVKPLINTDIYTTITAKHLKNMTIYLSITYPLRNCHSLFVKGEVIKAIISVEE